MAPSLVFHQVASSVTVLTFADDGAFNLSNIGSACSFEHNGDTLTGKCFGQRRRALLVLQPAITETVNADGTVNEDTDCGNSNSVCQATGAIGDAATFGVCIPDTTFTAASDCPSGTFAVDKGDGTFRCVPPSAVECNGLDAETVPWMRQHRVTVASSITVTRSVVSASVPHRAGLLAWMSVAIPTMTQALPHSTPRVHDQIVQIPTVSVSRPARLVTQPPLVPVLHAAMSVVREYDGNR